MRGSRKGILALGLATALLTMSACSPNAATTSDQAADDKVEVFSWWTGPGEQEGLDALTEDFKRNNPGIEFINATVSGGAGTNAKSVLATRLQANDPPDSFQAHAGLELTSDIKAGRVEDLTGLYNRQGWRDKFPKGLIDAITVDGRVYSVPVNIHRANLLWYSPKTLQKVGIAAPPKTWTEFLTQATTYRAKGIVPLAVGPLWAQKQLLESVLLGELGADAYSGLWNDGTDWTSPVVVEALTTAAKVFAASDVKTASSDWQPAMDKVTGGTAAYSVMGDWAYTYNINNRGLAYNSDFGVVASPGSTGVYDFLSDSFTMAKGAPHAGAAEKWLIECGSVAGQDLFNPLKGSVPARTDGDKAKYTGYLASAIAEWQDPDTKIVGSLAHGVVASVALNDEVDTMLKKFVEDGDAQAFADSFVKAYQSTR
jgi:glucose/mannose transport system substrate-binding protein